MFKEWFRDNVLKDLPKSKFIIDYWSMQVVEVPFQDVYYDSEEDANLALEVLQEELVKNKSKLDLIANPKDLSIQELLVLEKEIRDLKRKFCNERWGGCVKSSKEKKQQLLSEWYDKVTGNN